MNSESQLILSNIRQELFIHEIRAHFRWFVAWPFLSPLLYQLALLVCDSIIERYGWTSNSDRVHQIHPALNSCTLNKRTITLTQLKTLVMESTLLQRLSLSKCSCFCWSRFQAMTATSKWIVKVKKLSGFSVNSCSPWCGSAATFSSGPCSTTLNLWTRTPKNYAGPTALTTAYSSQSSRVYKLSPNKQQLTSFCSLCYFSPTWFASSRCLASALAKMIRSTGTSIHAGSQSSHWLRSDTVISLRWRCQERLLRSLWPFGALYCFRYWLLSCQPSSTWMKTRKWYCARWTWPNKLLALYSKV